MDFGSHSEVAINLRALSVYHHNSHTSALRLILGDFGVRIISLEVLNFLKMRGLLYRTHVAVVQRELRRAEGDPRVKITDEVEREDLGFGFVEKFVVYRNLFV
jgi:hypothetical protein